MRSKLIQRHPGIHTTREVDYINSDLALWVMHTHAHHVALAAFARALPFKARAAQQRRRAALERDQGHFIGARVLQE